MARPLALLLLLLLLAAGCNAKKAVIPVASIPPGALATVHYGPKIQESRYSMPLGTTPVEATVDFGRHDHLWLAVEQRGYAPAVIRITPESAGIDAVLDPFPDPPPETVARSILVATPRLDIVHRGTVSNTVSRTEQDQAAQALGAALAARLGDRAAGPFPDERAASLLKPLWRDGRVLMETADPVRVSFMASPPVLETTTSRRAAGRLGELFQRDAVLIVQGRQSLETGSLVTSKIGLHVAGTAASLASAQGRAMARGDSSFAYTVYTPSFSQGFGFSAILVHCRTGTVLWMNRGILPAIDFTARDAVDGVAEIILTNLPNQ